MMEDGNMTLAEDRAARICDCGKIFRGEEEEDRVIGGSKAKIELNPWQALVMSCKPLTRGQMECDSCGGTLLNKRYILTATHCLIQKDGKDKLPSDVKVGLGTEDFSQGLNWSSMLEVEKIIKHSNYVLRKHRDGLEMKNDIALLKLKKAVKFGPNTKPACLPSDKSKTYTNSMAVVSGYGIWDQKDLPQHLRKTYLNILPFTNRFCRYKYANDKKEICAHMNGSNSCQGDSGGPLFVDDGGRNTVVGVLSYGPKSCGGRWGSVFTRVTGYLDWINKNIKDGNC